MKRITDAAELAVLPLDSVVQTHPRGDVRIKTNIGDEWSFVMDSEEILREGRGAVWVLDKHEGEW